MAYLNRNILFLLLTGLIIVQAYASPYKDLNIDFLLEDPVKDTTKTVPKKKPIVKKKSEKSFESIIKDFEKIEGLFTLYWDRKTNKAFISILPDQLENIYLAGLTRQAGDGYYLDGSSMLNE